MTRPTHVLGFFILTMLIWGAIQCSEPAVAPEPTPAPNNDLAWILTYCWDAKITIWHGDQYSFTGLYPDLDHPLSSGVAVTVDNKSDLPELLAAVRQELEGRRIKPWRD